MPALSNTPERVLDQEGGRPGPWRYRAQRQLLDLIEDLRTEGAAIVLSTHDLSCVSTCAGQVACLNRRLIAYGPPTEVLTEEVLNQTFGTHLLLVHMDGQAYAYQHHVHEGEAMAEPGHSEPPEG